MPLWSRQIPLAEIDILLLFLWFAAAARTPATARLKLPAGASMSQAGTSSYKHCIRFEIAASMCMCSVLASEPVLASVVVVWAGNFRCWIIILAEQLLVTIMPQPGLGSCTSGRIRGSNFSKVFWSGCVLLCSLAGDTLCLLLAGVRKLGTVSAAVAGSTEALVVCRRLLLFLSLCRLV